MAIDYGTPVVPATAAASSAVRGYNLWTWRDHLMYLLESRMNTAASADLTEPVIFRALNDAHLTACRMAGFRRSAEISVNVVASQTIYDIPAYVLQDRIVHARFGDGTGWNPLSFISPQRFMELYPDSTVTGTPIHMAIVPESRELWLGPAPQLTTTGGLRITAETLPDPLYRVCHSSRTPVTATLTSGSMTVTLTGAPTGEIYPGDEFGLVPTLQSESSALIEASPLLWFTVATVAVPLVTLALAEAYTGPNIAGASFITAQVPSLERVHPGLYGFTVPQLAAANLLMTRQPDIADRLRFEALQVFDFQTDTSFRCVTPKTAVAFRSTLLRGY